MKQSLNIFILLTVAAFSLWCTGDLMRKCDQAAILAGANDLAHGRMHNPSAYYQFDKTYVLYGICAALLKIVPTPIPPVAAANVGLALIFWSALTVFVVRFRRTLEPVVFLCFLTAPAVLFNTLYVNSSVLSSAFLLLSAVFLFKDGSRGGWLAALFFFLAVGARADVILLLPLLLWLITPLPMVGNLRTVFSNVWKISAAGILALVTGRILCRSGATVDLFFNTKMVAGYVVFGFGAAGLLFTIYAARLTAQAAKGQGLLAKLYGTAGLIAFLLPVLFFIPQLHAPRYFWRGCEAVLLLAAAGRLPTWKGGVMKAGVMLAALLPVFFGVKLPVLNRPQVTVSLPALFPSGDGFYPMGGYGSFLLQMRSADRIPFDHNQLVWSAVHSASLDFSSDGTLNVLRTPMYGYFMLEASLRGGFAECRDYAELSNRCFYADSRSLMRADPKTPLEALQQILVLPAHFVSPSFDGVGVLQFGQGDDQWGRQTRLLNRMFAGNEYRILPPGRSPDVTKQSLCFSQNYFEGGVRDAETGIYYLNGAQCTTIDESVFCAETSLPQWMSIQTFRGR